MSLTNPNYYGGDLCARVAEKYNIHHNALLFNAWCYIWRAGRKASYIENFVKANWYLKRWLANADLRTEFEQYDSLSDAIEDLSTRCVLPKSIIFMLGCIATNDDDEIGMVVNAIDLCLFIHEQSSSPNPVGPEFDMQTEGVTSAAPAFTYTDGFWDRIDDKSDPRKDVTSD